MSIQNPALFQLACSMACLLLFASCNAFKAKVEEGVRETGQAERAAAENLTTQLRTAALTYQAANAKPPEGFSDFVTDQPIAQGEAYTLSLHNMSSRGSCSVSKSLIDCPDTFKGLKVRYLWNDGAIQSEMEEGGA